jgi:hypothetical protein
MRKYGPEVTRMVLIDVLIVTSSLANPEPQVVHIVPYCSVVMLTTSHTTTTGMLPVLPHTSVTGAHMATMFPGVGESI